MISHGGSHACKHTKKGDSMAQDQPKKKRGCLFWGCLTVAVLSLLVVGAGVAVYMYGKHMVNQITADEPEAIPAYDATAEEVSIAQNKLESLRVAVREGKAVTVSFTDRDLNTLIQHDATLAELKGKVHVSIDGSVIGLQTSVPLDKLGIPFLAGKYFNGKLDMEVRNDNGKPQLFVRNVTVKGKPAPDEALRQWKDVDMIDYLRQRDPNFQQAYGKLEEKVEELDVRDGKIIVRLKERGATPPPPPEGN